MLPYVSIYWIPSSALKTICRHMSCPGWSIAIGKHMSSSTAYTAIMILAFLSNLAAFRSYSVSEPIVYETVVLILSPSLALMCELICTFVPQRLLGGRDDTSISW